jgi:4-coumarate--CoA ligase
VAPAELEGTLLGHPDVSDCCIVGVEDERSGELPLAFVVLTGAARRRSMESPQAAANVKKSIQHVSDMFLPLPKVGGH